MAFRFGAFLYDPVGRGLTRNGVEIPLTHKSRELLLLFLHNPGRLLARDEIVERVWPDVAVTDDALRFQVAELRRAFGSKGEDFIRTLRGEGYRWEEGVSAAADRPVRSPGPGDGAAAMAAPRFRLVLDSREVQLLEGENVIGRDPVAALWIDHPSVSRRHARIVVQHGKATLEDLKSKNGTHVNAKPIAGRVKLTDGDEVRIGPETMVFRAAAPTTTRTEIRE
jgi:DNA-binding winged helix-turn-helix (wHTH) protein